MTSLSINPDLPKRGEIWLVNFDPTVGAEIKKVRPAVVISSDSVGKLPIKLIAPITDWKTYFSSNFWHVKIEPNSINRLNKDSAIDTLQLRGVDLQRFIRKLGSISEITMLEIIASIVTVIEFEV
ncbi:type II toxin-antitoxin system PemK/MazF family toxin [Dolichospermum circinale]|uniref:type II toxin-antitoxin system PemK/MazF family toxin n=1 Tax=Dolichospermum circinale TaxID=109265 RepID=UPI000486ED98|nr:type II toxin-antitoxin system PemK/MazF family toxin [Dolichospermum circinale]MDB9462059.1 type II toxin-antitoxin system PemK/MazF family toxin [Dolichospermum circinale CS-541/04]MDB9548465.1 type II toxin-antitoxin system PemK/MazF family toxin [Dolichospermum circinale CS-1031]